MSNIAAVIVTYNRKELLKLCIEKLRAQTWAVDILVVDNASTDGTNELFVKPTENIFYFNTGSNIGGAGGFNYGIRKAVEKGYEYLWILDDDTMPMPNALEKLIEADKKLKGNYGFLSSKALWKDGSICTMNIQKNTKWRQMKTFDKEQTIEYASFVSLFLKSSIIKRVGLPYKEFFIWADDWEYTRRISKITKCFFIPESIVYHFCNSNVGANIITADNDRMERFKYMYRNDVVMYRQDGFEGLFYLTVRNIVHILRIIIDGKNIMEKISLIAKATSEGKTFNPKIEFPEKD